MIFISPTQDEKFRRCQRLIGYEYVERIAPPTTTKQGFGTEVHAELAEWLSRGKMPSDTPAGLTARQGIRNNWLPSPSTELLVEHEFDISVAPQIRLRGIIDCLIPGKIPVIIDHKTTSDLKWTKTQNDLAKDSQAIIYSVYAALKFQSSQVRARWVYYSSSNPENGQRKPTGAKAVEVLFEIGSPEFISEWDRICADVNRISEIRLQGLHAAELEPSPQSCDAFGGCFFQSRCQLTGEDLLVSAIKQEERKSK